MRFPNNNNNNASGMHDFLYLEINFALLNSLNIIQDLS